METQIEILVVGTHVQILQTVLRLLNTNTAWKAKGVCCAEEALLECKAKEYQILLLGAGLTDETEQNLSAAVKSVNPDIRIIPHYGGGSGLLFAEIYLALRH